MKKSILALLLLMSMILVFCVGCGGNDEPLASVSATMAPTAEPTAEPEATEEPEATPEPTEEPEEPAEEEEPVEEPAEEEEPAESSSSNNSGNSGNSGNSAPAEPDPTPAPTAEPEVDKFAVAQGMIGASVSDLIAAIGSPNGSDYTASCLVMDGLDGLLYYGDFTVATIQYGDGSEFIMGVY